MQMRLMIEGKRMDSIESPHTAWGHVTEGPSLLTYDKLLKRLETVLLNPKSQPYDKNQAWVNEEWVGNVAHQKLVNL